MPGDVADADHRAALVELVADLGGLDLLVLNASTLGPLPMRPLSQTTVPTELGEVFRTNAGAPGSLMIALTDSCRRRDGVVVGISSDAAVNHYETWGAYGASKAALDHLVLTFGAETGLTTYAVDPGDMRTPMHQDAFPGEDISDRPLPGHGGAPAARARRATPRRRPLRRERRGSIAQGSRRWPAHDDPHRALGSPVPRPRRVDRCLRRPRCVARRATTYACSSRGPVAWSTTASATWPTCSTRATWSW